MRASPEPACTGRPAPFVDLALARRLEGAHAERAVRYAAAKRRLYPDAASAVEALGGGHAVYAGADAPVNQAYGLGLVGPAGADEVQRLLHFYAARGLPAGATVCPLADATWIAGLARAGFALESFTNVLVQALAGAVAADRAAADPGAQASAAVRVAPVRPDQEELWLETVARGFADAEAAPEAVRRMIAPNLHSAGASAFLAWIGDEPAGGGTLVVHAGVAELGSDSVRVGCRGRGVQMALLRARLAAAADAGCDLALVLTEPGGASQRNAERAGFCLAYTNVTVRQASGAGA